MSRTRSHKPWKYTEHGKQSITKRNMFRNGEIPFGVYRGLSDTVPFDTTIFAKPRAAAEIRRQFNRRNRHEARAIIKRSQTFANFYSFDFSDFDDFLYAAEAGLFEPYDENMLEMLPKNFTGRNNVRWYLM